MKQWAIDQELSMMEVCTYVPCVCMSLCMHFDHQIQEDLWVRMVLRSLLYCVQVILVATCMFLQSFCNCRRTLKFCQVPLASPLRCIPSDVSVWDLGNQSPAS